MERDKARIKPFCDQLAQLWESRCPDLFPKPFREESVKINPVYQR